jgi:hypothetical protein
MSVNNVKFLIRRKMTFLRIYFKKFTCFLCKYSIIFHKLYVPYLVFFQYFLGEPTGLKLVHFGKEAERPARPGFVAMWPETFKPTDVVRDPIFMIYV